MTMNCQIIEMTTKAMVDDRELELSWDQSVPLIELWKENEMYFSELDIICKVQTTTSKYISPWRSNYPEDENKYFPN